jgi:hypothetical protein
MLHGVRIEKPVQARCNVEPTRNTVLEAKE